MAFTAPIFMKRTSGQGN